MTFDLITMRKPLDDVRLPNGRTFVPAPWGPPEYQAWREAQQETDPKRCGALVLQIVRACYPNITDEDILDCEPQMLYAMAAHAGGKIDQIRDALKNADVAAALPEAAPRTSDDPAATTHSSPKTSGVTSSRKSRRPSAAIGGTSTSPDLTASLT